MNKSSLKVWLDSGKFCVLKIIKVAVVGFCFSRNTKESATVYSIRCIAGCG